MRLTPFVFAIAFIAPLIHGESETTPIPDDDMEWTNYGLTGRIVNGTKAALRQFPYQVSLSRSYNSRHFCGGSLIDEYTVFTAAHCMFMSGSQIQAWTIKVVGGQLELNKPTFTSQERGVDKIYVHPEFVASTLQNDVAILVLKVPFTLTPEVNVVQLAANPITPNTVCQVAGWGYPYENSPEVTDDLMYVDLPLLSPASCRKLLVNVTNLLPGMYCAGYLEGQRDTCQGDSGSGMVCNGVLTGAVSGGEGCARPAMPGVYSSTYFFRDWIQKYAKTPRYVQLEGSGSEQVAGAILLPFVLLSVLLNV